ncbi:MAG: lactate utilization protein [Ignavibacteria bacterium]|nr:lactate utilization protein [Ignavibacteria bacterium]MBI3766033.1 lactate utilization protein [Ignavibacteriales bacterium]
MHTNISATPHAKKAEVFLRDEPRANWHDTALWWVRQKRDNAARTVPEWEQLREAASQIKNHTLSNLDEYLEEFEKNAQRNGVIVHWAIDAQEHNEIILEIIRRNAVRKVVKSKSMLTEECHLNEFLLEHEIEVTDTDLGERIVQLRNEPPSHIVLPAIHLKKEDVSETFYTHLGTDQGIVDPEYLTRAARHHLRKKFLECDLAITGVNFAVAETGGFVVCTNEGNADLGVHCARIHVASMGIEKLIPKAEHLGVFLRLLARSATGQPITTYSSHFHRPRDGQEMHVVIVDNRRSQLLESPDFRSALKCIRCGACFNTCPVYRRSGGYSYHNAVAGPIGAILAPNHNMATNADLPFASTLCGSCSNVCPVKIDIHDQLWKWRQVITQEGVSRSAKRIGMKVLSFILSRPKVYRTGGKLMRRMMRRMPWLMKSNVFNPWYKQREMPTPALSFREWYVRNRR